MSIILLTTMHSSLLHDLLRYTMYDLIDGYELQYYTIFKADKVYKTKKTNCTIAN